ncbi:energy transducer TonB [Occallatibacter riparius]|uniref:Energy transducer TonB n=1 Tax=Occallatibacter riparius TaxID=1002689 RepID=A0A9J7BMS7_9BACT|nr:energy transducer TonB [Occallatibacter riparius]UWZ82222.1 energy transducer TonB [Occallatibacter riparius]
MRKSWAFLLLLCTLACAPQGRAEDTVKRILKAVEQCTLDQRGTPPFHLKATLAPSSERDKDSGRTGEVEIWWRSPDQWRREVRSPEFHQVQIVNGSKIWQKDEGDYFPEWLRETADAIVRPVPMSDDLLAQIRGAEVRHETGGTYLAWTIASSNGQVQKTMGAGVSIRDDSGLLLSAGGFGWSGEFEDYAKFHKLTVARTVNVGSPQVTAKIVLLEDLSVVQGGWFDASAPDGDEPINTVLMNELTTRENLVAQNISWPMPKDGPLEGVLTTEVSIDRAGKVREIGTIVSDNPAMNGAAHEQIAAMRFKPFVIDGVAVQVLSRITLAFKTARPTGTEAFESARNYFERGRQLDFPSGGAGFPYMLKAEFQARSSAGSVDTGHYGDLWVAADKWRREATFGSSHLVRARNGSKLYEQVDGPDAQLLLLVFRLMEPIPAMDSFVESDWRMQSGMVGDRKTIRVLSGYESSEGKLDPEARGFWFDTNGNLVKTYGAGMEALRSEFVNYQNAHLARRIDVSHDAAAVMHIRVTDIAGASDSVPKNAFEIKGHEVNKQFTSEAR